LDDVLKIRDQAEALRVYIKCISGSLDTANAASEVKLRAERKAGEMLAAMDKNKGAAVPTRSHDVTTLDDLGIDKMTSSRWQREAAVDEDTFVEYLATCQCEGKEVTQAGLLNIARGCHVNANSGENEWYTPPQYIEAARDVMGGIDLDPATCETAQANVRAKKFFTSDDDGLSKKWTGNVWLNPPYGKDLIGHFAAKVVEESQRFEQAVILINNATDTAWFHEIASIASAVCLIRGRIKFLDKSGKPANTPVQGQVAIYVGKNVEAFRSMFSSFGLVVVPVREMLH
jgi:ParB family chromosome partitioning protein